MKPCGLLVHEHGHIGKVIDLMKDEIQSIRGTECVDMGFIDTAADFIGNYIGYLHQTKEEMLFNALSRKKISDDDFMMMSGLVEDHQADKKIADEVLRAKDCYAQGDAGSLPVLIDRMEALVAFYPQHMEKEESVFFPRAEKYFSQEELHAMLREFQDFNEAIIRKSMHHLRNEK